jgi:hypothetical protein
LYRYTGKAVTKRVNTYSKFDGNKLT